jgi:HTH-type transcriptional regulator/antitoxin HigA
MNIRLLSTDEDYKEALAEIRRLWDTEPGSENEAQLELLAMLVQNYERSREPLPDLDPIEAIKFRMEQQGLTRKDLLPIFGTSARVSEVLSGKRALTLEMVRKLHAAFAIPLESLIAAPAPRQGTRRPAKPSRTRRTGGRRSGAHA